MRIARAFDRAGKCLVIANVRSVTCSGPSSRANLSSGCVQFFLCAADERYLRAVLCEPFGYREIYPASPAGDDGGLAIENLFAEHFRHPLVSIAHREERKYRSRTRIAIRLGKKENPVPF